MQGNRKVCVNVLLLLCTTLITMAGKMTPETAGVLGMIAAGFNGANAYEHKANGTNGRSNGA